MVCGSPVHRADFSHRYWEGRPCRFVLLLMEDEAAEAEQVAFFVQILETSSQYVLTRVRKIRVLRGVLRYRRIVTLKVEYSLLYARAARNVQIGLDLAY